MTTLQPANPDEPELGPCCACGQASDTVRNIIMLDKRAPTPGVGCWACFVCNLPAEGAVAVLCDDCLGRGAHISFACDGPPGSGRRVPIEQLTETFDHDMSKHQGETAWMN